MKVRTVRFRFYGQLNDFLRPRQKGTWFSYDVKGKASVKDTIESLGVVHVEVDGIMVNGKPEGFSYSIKDGDKIRVYPSDTKLSARHRKHLLPKIPLRPKFVLDSHLGKLVRHLRLLGFDVLYKKIFPDVKIIKASVRQKRIALTRDIGLLKQKVLQSGYWV